MSATVTFETTHSAKSAAGCETVFSIWQDVNRWPDWDLGLEKCDFNGEFAPGTQFTLTPRGAPNAVDAVLTVVKNDECFIDETTLPFGKVSFVHEVKKEQGGCLITHSIKAEISEEHADLFEKNIFQNMKNGLAPSVEGLARKAEETETI